MTWSPRLRRWRPCLQVRWCKCVATLSSAGRTFASPRRPPLRPDFAPTPRRERVRHRDDCASAQRQQRPGDGHKFRVRLYFGLTAQFEAIIPGGARAPNLPLVHYGGNKRQRTDMNEASHEGKSDHHKTLQSVACRSSDLVARSRPLASVVPGAMGVIVDNYPPPPERLALCRRPPPSQEFIYVSAQSASAQRQRHPGDDH